MYCFKERRKNPMYVSSVHFQPDILAKKKLIQEKTYYNPPLSCFLKEEGIFTRHKNIMALGMRRQFAAWMPVQAHGSWAALVMMNCCCVTFYVHKRVTEPSKTKYTFKYCQFLAWVLLGFGPNEKPWVRFHIFFQKVSWFSLLAYVFRVLHNTRGN